MIPREFVGFLAVVLIIFVMFALAGGEMSHLGCQKNDPFVMMGVIPLYAC